MTTRIIPLALLAACSLSPWGCTSSSAEIPTRLKPLPDTGTLQIEMNGTWEVTEFEVLDEWPWVERGRFTGETVEDVPEGDHRPLQFPLGHPALGSTIQILDDQFHAAGTRPLASRAVLELLTTRYCACAVTVVTSAPSTHCGLYTHEKAKAGHSRLRWTISVWSLPRRAHTVLRAFR